MYVVQGPPRPPGQPGQDGRDGHNGHAPQLPRGMINVPGVAPAPLDTTGLENSFENLGRTMVDVLAMRQQTNLTLQDQIRRANDAQIDQTLAMHDLADITEQRTYDSMFAAVPIYHGKDDEDFDEWADQLEALCEISHRNIHHEMMGRSSAAVKKIIRSIDPNLRWSLARQELKRCVSDEKSIAQSAFKLNTLVQKPNENVHMYIIKYANLHQTVTGKRPEQETDQSHLTKFLTSINNVEISREICRQGIPHGTTLQDLFLKVTEKEVGQQLAEGVALARSAQVMEIQDMGYEINELGQIKRGYRGLQCWSCRGTDHLQKDCKLGHDDDDQFDGYDRKVGHMRNTLVTESDVTSSMMGEMYRQLASAQLRGKLYKTGYRKAKAYPKEVQTGTTSQNTAMTTGCGVSAIATGMPAASAPNTSQFRTPSRSVRLVTVPKGPVATQTMTVNTSSSPIPQTPIVSMRQIQDKTPQTLTNIRQPSNTTATAPVQKAAVVAKRNLRSRAQPMATCQMLDMIEEVNEDSQAYPNFDISETESEAADLCEILDENSDLGVYEPLIYLAVDQTGLTKGYEPKEYFTELSDDSSNSRVELVTVGTTVGATVPATLEHTLCNALVDMGTTRSCLSEEYYQQLLLPGLKPVHKLQVRTASGSSLCPTGTVTCDFKLGKQPFSFEFIVCRGLSRPCILGLDFLRKYKIGIGWSPTGKFQLDLHQQVLVESVKVYMSGPMLQTRQCITIPSRSLMVLNAKATIDRHMEGGLHKVVPNFLLSDEYPELVLIPTVMLKC